MRTVAMIRRDLSQVLIRTLLALFLIPGIVWLLSLQMVAEWEVQFRSTVERNTAEPTFIAEKLAATYRAYQADGLPALCASNGAAPADMRAIVCKPYSSLWQLYWAARTAKYTVMAGGLLLLATTLLGLVAFLNRAAQYGSLVLGWRLLSLASAAEVIVQSAMAVFLSFWLSIFLTGHYFIKLVILVGLGAALAALVAVVMIFARRPVGMAIEGELVPEADAPALWTRVRAFAARMGTAAPEHIVAGIDANFFVTETPISVNDHQVSGRTLYVSVPLLRVLDESEADAVVVHELAHLKGGDTSNGAALGPKLAQFDAYREGMRGAGLTVIAYHLLSLYRFLFELALMRDSREREFMADREAARAIGGLPLIRALIKIAAYSTYRARIEQALFARQDRHQESIGIASFVADGLPAFARSGDFLSAMETASVPHPFDSHPLLQERMRHVGSIVEAADFGAVVAAAQLPDSWATKIDTAHAIEARLWAGYEARFAAAHEYDLAFRYLPEGDEQTALVETHFPQRDFALKDGQRIAIRFDGILLPEDGKLLAWDDVTKLHYEEGYGGDVLTITSTKTAGSGSATAKVKLTGIGDQRAPLKEALGLYWQRHKVSHGKD